MGKVRKIVITHTYVDKNKKQKEDVYSFDIEWIDEDESMKYCESVMKELMANCENGDGGNVTRKTLEGEFHLSIDYENTLMLSVEYEE